MFSPPPGPAGSGPLRDGDPLSGPGRLSGAPRRPVPRGPAGVSRPDPAGRAHPGPGPGGPEGRPARHGPPGRPQASVGGTSTPAPPAGSSWGKVLLLVVECDLCVQVEEPQRISQVSLNHTQLPVPKVTHTHTHIDIYLYGEIHSRKCVFLIRFTSSVCLIQQTLRSTN